MIRLSRQQPTTSLVGSDRVELERRLIERRSQGKDPLKSVWKKAKSQLKSESHNKCGYCEADTAVVAHGDVEHYRPKSRYWWLAYNLDNFVYSCQICNQSFKGSRFPVSGPVLTEPVPLVAGNLGPDASDQATVTAFELQHQAEAPILPHPYFDDPETVFIWFIDDALEEVEIRVDPTNSEANNIETEIETSLGLNREELRRLRYPIADTVRVLIDAHDQVNQDLQTRIKTRLQKMTAPEAPFAAVARFQIAQANFAL